MYINVIIMHLPPPILIKSLIIKLLQYNFFHILYKNSTLDLIQTGYNILHSSAKSCTFAMCFS